jgi:hypothetical protein
VLEVLQYQAVDLLLGKDHCHVPKHLASSSSGGGSRGDGGGSGDSSGGGSGRGGTAKRGKTRRGMTKDPAVDINASAATAGTAAGNPAAVSSSGAVGRLSQSGLRELLEPKKLPPVQCTFKVGCCCKAVACARLCCCQLRLAECGTRDAVSQSSDHCSICSNEIQTVCPTPFSQSIN